MGCLMSDSIGTETSSASLAVCDVLVPLLGAPPQACESAAQRQPQPTHRSGLEHDCCVEDNEEEKYVQRNREHVRPVRVAFCTRPPPPDHVCQPGYCEEVTDKKSFADFQTNRFSSLSGRLFKRGGMTPAMVELESGIDMAQICDAARRPCQTGQRPPPRLTPGQEQTSGA